MNRQEILEKIINEEDKILVSKLLDKIEFVAKRNSVEHTEFLDMRQRQILEKILLNMKYTNYVALGGHHEAERTLIILYPSKLEEVFKNNHFDYDTIFSVIRITLPNELKGMYHHRDYLGAVIKIGIKREKVGDIITSINGADFIVQKDATKYILEGLKKLTRFSKSKFDVLSIKELNEEKQTIQKLKIIIPSMRIDSIVSEVIRTSRAKTVGIIKEERIFVNHELITKSSKEVKQGDIITVRGKGRFVVGNIINTTKKGNLVLEIEKHI